MKLFALLAILLPVQPSPPTLLPPRDVCAQDASFVQFRADLLDILVRRDRERLLAVIAPDIHVSFGGEAGRADFVRAWNLDPPLDSRLWRELADVLMLGCAVDGAARVAPYAFHWPEADSIGTSFLAYPGAEVRRAADDASPVIATLNWMVIEDASPDAPPQTNTAWRRVRLPDGRLGFVRNDDLRVDIGYRATFEQRAGRWMLTSFVAGD